MPAVIVTSPGTPMRASVSTIASSIDLACVTSHSMSYEPAMSQTSTSLPRARSASTTAWPMPEAPPTTTCVVGSVVAPDEVIGDPLVSAPSRGPYPEPTARDRARARAPGSAAVEPFGVAGEELLAGVGVEMGGGAVVCGVQLVERPVHGVDGEVAREHAAVDAERLDAVLDPRTQHGRVRGVQGHRQPGQLAVDVVAHRRERRDPPPPERELLGLIGPRPAGVLDDHGEVAPVGQRRRRALELVGMRHELEHEITFVERAEDVAVGHAHAATHRPDAAEAA